MPAVGAQVAPTKNIGGGMAQFQSLMAKNPRANEAPDLGEMWRGNNTLTLDNTGFSQVMYADAPQGAMTYSASTLGA